ncbi:MAG: FecR domain-containing protein, partial [Opitutaceae bacterium]
MSQPSPDSTESILRATAARWTVRRDRGLSAAESIEYELWLAADPRHAAAMRRSVGAWARLDRLSDHTAHQTIATATRRRSYWRRALALTSLAAAAAVAVGLFTFRRSVAPAAPVAAIAPSGPRTVTLSDGSLVQLNTGAEVTEEFTATERRVLLGRGEAHFSVTKNPARPFIVTAGALQVRAVGTAFNINLQSDAVDVLVTEGRIAVSVP